MMVTDRDGCPFCDPAVWKRESHGLENEHCVFLYQPSEILPGGGLIVPRAHRVTVFDLTPAEWTATYDLMQRVKAVLDEAMRPHGYTVGWNNGAVAGQTVFHAHLHLIPRFADEPLAGHGIRSWLKQPVNRRLKPGLLPPGWC